jgi:asparagine synthase (glutamine-hydrolysing)
MVRDGLAITYNGEIYNYVELRDELRARGHSFESTGDTEVLLAGYREWGSDVLSRLDGMYAFVVYDARARTLFGARDPVGQKPLLYYCGRDGIVFASELTSLLAHPAVPRTMDREALAHYLVYEGYIAPFTALEGVSKLPPGHGFRYGLDTGDIDVFRHWEPVSAPVRDVRELPAPADYDALESVLRSAVARHLRSDVPVGVYLSGGIDSTTVATLATDVLGRGKVQTYTVASEVSSFDESAEARATAKRLGTDHHESTLSSGRLLETLPEILEKLDEPLSDPGLVAIYQVADFAVKHVKVILSGDGGDELLCGYPPFAKWGLSEWLERQPAWLVRGLLRGAIDRLPAQYGYMGLAYKASVFSRGFGKPAPIRNQCWVGSFLPSEIRGLLVGGRDVAAMRPGADGIEGVYDHVVRAHAAAVDHDPIARLGYEYQTTYLPYCICAHTDKANMMHSLEARSPFLDVEAIRALNALPSSWKLRDGQGKWMLREYLKRRHGPTVAKKRKQGFTIPLALWLRGPMRPLAEEMLDPELLRAAGLFEVDPVRRLWDEHLRGRANHYKKLWTLIVIQAWWQRRIRGA